MLNFFPAGCKAARQGRSNFGDWIRSGTGSYTVSSITTQEIVIETSSAEIGDVFLRDIEYFIDQCFEHVLESLAFASDAQMRSDAWSVVTIYYHAFYAAQAVMRLLGEATLFFDKTMISSLRTIAGTAVNPGAGLYLFAKRKDLSATQSEYVFQKNSRKPHEAVWKHLLQKFDAYVADPVLATDAKEIEYFGALSTKRLFKIYLDYDWPSKVRYRANYNPGFAYLLLIQKQITDAKHLIERWREVKATDFGRIISDSSYAAINDLEIGSYRTHVQLLHDLAIGCFTLVRHLYLDLKSRRKFDPRWEADRTRFLAKAGIDSSLYPFLSSS